MTENSLFACLLKCIEHPMDTSFVDGRTLSEWRNQSHVSTRCDFGPSSRAVYFTTSLICIFFFWNLVSSLSSRYILVHFLLDQKHLNVSILFSYMHHIMMKPPPNFTAGSVFAVGLGPCCRFHMLFLQQWSLP